MRGSNPERDVDRHLSGPRHHLSFSNSVRRIINAVTEAEPEAQRGALPCPRSQSRCGGTQVCLALAVFPFTMLCRLPPRGLSPEGREEGWAQDRPGCQSGG